jgi:very-short-patch-repair endonuclease
VAAEKTLSGNARFLRRALTPAEALLWTLLRTPPLNEWHFRRQVPFPPRYIADFASHRARFVIEADGVSHDQTAFADAERTAWLGSRGYRVIRVRNADILADRDMVWRMICALVAEREPPPRSAAPSRPPRKGEG